MVLLIIDQLPAWIFDRDLPHLDAGIARLAREGIYYRNATLPYSIAYTAPGHAAIATGAPPAVTGILSNDWYDRERGEEIAAVDDPTARVFQISADGAVLSQSSGSSGRLLRIDGLADRLRLSTGGEGKSIAISAKDRAAILCAGQHPDLAIWYDQDQRAMTTSSYYIGNVPAWLLRFYRNHSIEAELKRTWEPLDADALAAITQRPDDGLGEGGFIDGPPTFPHRLADAPSPARAFRATPFADELVLATAKAAIAGEALGQDEVPDLLVLSFSAHDYVGHQFGQESWERLDVLMRLDRALEEFRAHLDAVVGKDKYAVAMTSDHGATALVEERKKTQPDSHRVRYATVEQVAGDAANRVLGPGAWIAAVSASNVYLTPAALAASTADRDNAVTAIAAAIASIPGVAWAAATADLAPPCDAYPDARRRACASIDTERSGEIFFTAAEGSLISGNHQTGTGHGADTIADRTVPIIVWEPGTIAKTVSDEVSLTSVTATVANMLRIPPPSAASAALPR